MTTFISVARYHLVQRMVYLVLPGAALAFAFVIDLIIFATIPVHHVPVLVRSGPGPALVQTSIASTSGRVGGGLAAICAWLLIGGIMSTARSLPFGLALGVSRRSYFAGTVLLGVGLSVGYGLVLTVLQAIERATDGWGVSMHLFRLPYFLDGPWYLTWLTSSVTLAFLFVYGMSSGLVYRRWDLTGLTAFIAAQVVVVAAAVLAVTWGGSWASVSHFFTSLSATGLTGLLAALAAALVAAGYALVRRAAV